jgi:uncharacterized protein YdhG (YjbR/CyaY superfamily)
LQLPESLKMKEKKPKAVLKKKMQEVDFGSIEEFLEFLPQDELKIVELLRKIIFYCIPDIEEKISYNVPFYKRHSNICYIWPGSVQWGNVKHSGVQFGFNKGYLMQDEINWLDKGNRKQVYLKIFHSVKEIDVDLLKAYIYEAALVDEEFNRKKK